MQAIRKLLQAGLDRGEFSRNRRAYTVYGSYNRNGDSSRDQRIFDGGRAAIILEKANDCLHVLTLGRV